VADTLAAIHSLRASGTPRHHPSIATATKWLSRLPRPDALPDVANQAGLIQLADGAALNDTAIQSALPPAIEMSRGQWDDVRDAPSANRCLNRLRSLSVGLVDTLLTRQDHDGGWGTPDTTGMVVEAIAASHGDAASAAARRAVEYLRAAQRPDGSWSGTSGAIHATSHAIRGLLGAGVDDGDDAIAAAVNWLAVHQEPRGGWDDSTSRTSLALLALANAGRAKQPAALRAVSFLLDAQRDDGRWDDPQCVHRDPATNHPLRNDLRNVALPLEALSRWIVAADSAQSCGAPPMSLRLVAVTT
jgi:hypothetical protein